MQECLGINKVLQTILGELANNTSKLTETDKRKNKKTVESLKKLQMSLLFPKNNGSLINIKKCARRFKH